MEPQDKGRHPPGAASAASRDLGASDTWIRIVCAGLTIVVALAQLGAIAYYLVTGGDDWLSVGPSAGLCVLAVVMGVTLWRGRVAGRTMLLAPVLWRHWFAVCFLTLMVALATFMLVLGMPWDQWLRQTPLAVLVMGLWFLFSPVQDWESPVGLDSAQRRTWQRSIAFLALTSGAGVFATVLLVVLGLDAWAPLPLVTALALLALTALMRRGFHILQRTVEETTA